MNGLLSMIGMQTELEYQMEDFPFRTPRIKFNTPKGYRPSDRQKRQPKVQHEFTIKGVKIMAASRKDAIKKYNHRKNENTRAKNKEVSVDKDRYYLVEFVL